MDSSGKGGLPANAEGAQESNSLDHALLESLFYNEMALMDDGSSSLLPPHLFSSLSSSAGTEGAPEMPAGTARRRAASISDPGTIAEKAMLQDFGVNSLPVSTHAGLDKTADSIQWASSASGAVPPMPPPVVHGSSLPAVPSRPLSHAPVPAAKVPPSYGVTTSKITLSQGFVPNPLHGPAPPAQTPTHALAPEEKRRKLVSQFSTLASRLGITLPPQVVQVLQSTVDVGLANDTKPSPVSRLPAAAARPPTTSSSSASFLPTAPPTHPSASGRIFPPAVFPSRHQPAPLPAIIKTTPAVQQLQNTAEAAIAAVTEKRKRESTTASSAEKEKAAMTHSKRRKKPRLADCETRLAQLKSENELLKRHLHNISNKSHKFDQERLEAETKMKALIKQDAPDSEMDSTIKNYTELYSDYGRRRHQELTFHLEQLHRLANPTSFTKMGLWSLQNSNMDPKRNPVAGILQKELAITTPQGRKILEQRQKIRDVCANLKECFALIGKLKALCEQKTQIFHDRMTKCRAILSPKQVVKLLIWIDGHSHLLETVCPGWGSERIQSKKAQSKQAN